MTSSVKQERLFTGYSGRLFLTISAGWLLLQMGRQLIPPLLPEIIKDLAITSGQAGFALTVLGGLYALGQYPSGRLSDHLSRKTLLTAGLSLLILGFLIIQGTVSYPMFLLGTSVVGLGAGLYPTAARALVSDLFVNRRGQAFGIHTASGDLGNATAAGLTVAALAIATWQTAFLPVIVLLGSILIAIHIWSREAYVLKMIDLDIRSTSRRLLKNRRLRWLLIAYMLFSFTWHGAAGFLPTFLQVEKSFSVNLASSGYALFFITGTLVKPVSGLFGDRFGRVTVAIGAMFLGASGLASVVITESVLLILIGICIFAGGLMSFPPVMQAFLMSIFPEESMGGDLGAMRTVYVGLGSLGPAYVGYVAELQSYTVSFIGLIVCMILCVGIIIAYRLLQ